MSSVIACTGKKNSLLPGLSPQLTLIYDPKMAFTAKKLGLFMLVCMSSEWKREWL